MTSRLCLLLPVLLSGCGLLLDYDPQGLTGMDAGLGRPCETDSECNDGLFCNGGETCSGGRCAAGSAGCDDLIGCTLDSCNEATDRCGHEADDSMCEDLGECVLGVCNPDVGCQPQVSELACDDSIPCTIDSCTAATGVCEHAPDSTQCLGQDEVCTVGIGCRVVSCTGDGDCNSASNTIPCRTGTCVSGRCSYDADTMQNGNPCFRGECIESFCMNGTCEISRTETSCTSTDCVSRQCVRTAETGLVRCDSAINTTCDDHSMCTGAGTCSTDGVCVLGPPTVPCGANQRCDPATGACGCVTDFVDCDGDSLSCECPAAECVDRVCAIGCPPGFTSCGNDPSCSCDLSTSFCDTSTAAPTCRLINPCGATCDLSTHYCDTSTDPPTCIMRPTDCNVSGCQPNLTCCCDGRCVSAPSFCPLAPCLP